MRTLICLLLVATVIGVNGGIRPFNPPGFGQAPESEESLRQKGEYRRAVHEAAEAKREQEAAAVQAEYQRQILLLKSQARAQAEAEYYKTHDRIGPIHHINQYKVSDALPTGARIDLSGSDYFVYGLAGVFSDRTYTALDVLSAGSYSYQTVRGDTRRIPAYRVLNATERTELEELNALAAKVELQLYNKYKAQQEETKRNQKAEATKKVFAFRKEQADKNNSPASQFRVGQMYLNGEGTETNIDLGMTYIKQAASNGCEEAVSFLKK
jgi:TPR repeat protein